MINRATTVGILAYGSLIDDPGDELSTVITERIPDVLTPFPVEFARKSSSRGDAPTLVPHANGTQVRAAILVLNSSPEQAVDMLWRREARCRDMSRPYPGPRPDNSNAVHVEQLDGLSGIDQIFYTRIGSNVTPLTAERLADLALASVAIAKPGLDGISYLISTKENGVVTALSPAYEAEILRRVGADDLQSALAAIRGSDTPY